MISNSRDQEFEDLDFEINDPATSFLSLIEESQAKETILLPLSPRLLPKRVIHVLIVLSDHQERTIPLDNVTYSIGREPDNSIVLDDRTVSRHHAMLIRLPDSANGKHFYQLVDGNLEGQRSQNGISVNGQRCFSHDLKDQDVIAFSSEIQAVYRQFDLHPRDLSQPPNRSAKSISPPTESQENRDETEVLHLSKAVLARLSSCSEMFPHPIFEMDFEGNITYLNPVASSKFPSLKTNKQHPFKEGITEILSRDSQQSYSRKVTIGDRGYEQTVHRIPENQLIRSYLVDVTPR